MTSFLKTQRIALHLRFGDSACWSSFVILGRVKPTWRVQSQMLSEMGTRVVIWGCSPLGQSPWLRVNTSFPEEPRRQSSPRGGKFLPAQSLWFLLAYSSPLLSEEGLWHQNQRKGIKKGTINSARREDQVKLELLLVSPPTGLFLFS